MNTTSWTERLTGWLLDRRLLGRDSLVLLALTALAAMLVAMAGSALATRLARMHALAA